MSRDCLWGRITTLWLDGEEIDSVGVTLDKRLCKAVSVC